MNKNILMNNVIGIRDIVDNQKRNLVLTIIGLLTICVMAQIKIALPFTPVPITLQTLGVMLIGLSLDRKTSAATIIIYIVLGSLGLPVYSGFKSGFILNTATGGYIIGFFFATQICAYFSEKGYTKKILSLILVVMLSNIVIYTFGLSQLALFVPKGKVIAFGLIPFIPGDIIKMILAIAIIRSGWLVVKK